MIVVYRPELENPPMDKECTIGFSFITDEKKGNPEYIQLSSGVNRDFSEAIWQQIKEYDVVKNLLKLGALRIEEEAPDDLTVDAPTVDTIASMPIEQAMRLVEDSFDIAQLTRWDTKESRIRVKNAIARRMTAITEGKG